MKTLLPLITVLTSLIVADTAHALRCGSQLVQEGDHETEVIRLCGEPASVKQLGRVIRSFSIGSHRYFLTRRPVADPRFWYSEEVEVTEMIFNFGPRRFMRRLRFEGGILVSIRTMGYGYVE